MKEQKPSGKDTETRIVDGLQKMTREEHKALREHLMAIADAIRGDTEITKTRMEQIKKMVRRLLNKMGIGTDDIT